MTFKRARAALLVSLAAVLFLHEIAALSLCWMLLPAAVFAALLVYGSSRIQSNFFTKAYCGGDACVKEIALTFDDGPNSEFTPRILAKLAEFGAPAAFFLIGREIEGREELVRRMDAAGHAIGNHSFSHSNFLDFKLAGALKDELNRASEAIYRVIGKQVKLFRPPFGVTTPEVAKASEALDYDVVGWNVRSFDWVIHDEERLSRRVLRQIRPGAVILFHDASETTLRVVDRTLRYARDNGYKVVGLERLLGLKPYR